VACKAAVKSIGQPLVEEQLDFRVSKYFSPIMPVSLQLQTGIVIKKHFFRYTDCPILGRLTVARNPVGWIASNGNQNLLRSRRALISHLA
jgi:hypothetical protein